MPTESTADIGLIGLAVMGENLALNIADHGFKVAVYNRTTEVMRKFVAREKPPGGLVPCETTKDLVAAIKRPRKFIILDASQYSAATIVALATVVFALGAAYWLLRGSSTDRS